MSTMVGYSIAQVSQSFIISTGVYGGAPDFTVWYDGVSLYYGKNAYGVLGYSDTVFNDLLIDIIGDCSGDEVIEILSGNYAVDGSVQVWVNTSVTIRGAGIEKTVLYDTVGSSDAWFMVHASDVLIEGITFSGNYKSDVIFHVRRWAGDGDISNIVIRDCRFERPAVGHDAGGLVTVWDTEESDFRLYDVMFDSCVFTNDDEVTYDNVAVSWVKDVTFQDCYINLSKSFILYNAVNCKVSDSTFAHFHNYASLVVGGRGNVVSDNIFLVTVPIRINTEDLSTQGFNVFEGNVVCGAYVIVTLSGETIHGNTIANNVFYNSSEGGLYLTSSVANDCSYNVVTGNVFNYTQGHGIHVSNSSGNVISGNVLLDIGQGTGTFHGIYLYGSDNNTVTGNSLNGVDSYGIDLYDSSYNVVDGNRVNSYSEAIYDRGTSDYNIISNNIACKTSGGDDIVVTGGNTVEDNNIEVA